MKYPHLFSPIRIGPVEVANRVAVSAHHNNFDINAAPRTTDAAIFEGGRIGRLI